MCEWIGKIPDMISSLLYGGSMIALLLGAGILLSIRLRFFQVRGLPFILRNTACTLFKRDRLKENDGISPFQAVSTALAGTMGVGNIAGVATALTAGGPGAVFWMWVGAFFGMATKYAEIFLAVKFRRKQPEGGFRGGPMYYMEHGLGRRGMGCVFAVLCALSSFGIGNMTQANAAAAAALGAFSIPLWCSGAIIAATVALVIFGGIRRIAAAAELIVPIASAVYIICAVSILLRNPSDVGGAFSLILREAFTPRGAVGGVAGYGVMSAVRYGLSRGVFTNEAGLGSAPIAHAAAQTKSPAHQGAWGIFEVFLDTIVVCTLTALVLLCAQEGRLWRGGLDGIDMTFAAFRHAFGAAGGGFIAVSTVFFAVAGMLGWCYYGESAVGFLSRRNNTPIFLYRALFILCAFAGAVGQMRLIWELADILNALMAIPNILALWMLRKHIDTGH